MSVTVPYGNCIYDQYIDSDCPFLQLCEPHSKIVLLKCGAINELYMIWRVYFGRMCFSLFLTPNISTQVDQYVDPNPAFLEL